MSLRPKVLVISTAPVEAEMRGVAIRAFELARTLAPVADVVLASVAGSGTAPAVEHSMELATYSHGDPQALRPLIAAADVVVAQPQPPTIHRWLARSRARLVFDLYDPEVFENLAIFGERRQRLQDVWLAFTIDRLTAALRDGHGFICASEAQRDLWIGAMVAERLIPPDRYAADPSFRSVISVVPFGVPQEGPAAASGQGLRARFPAIGAHDRVVLWNGGIWSWLDPLSAVAAVAALDDRGEAVRLVFMGGSSHQAAAAIAERTREAASRRGLLDRVVFMNDAWVPYAQRGAWLLESDCALSTQHDHLETRYAYRTRLLDCFWAGLPIVCTEGDELAGRVLRDDLGGVAPPGDVPGLADRLSHVLARGRAAYAPQLAKAAREHAWPTVAAPLAVLVTAPDGTPRVSAGRRRLSPRPLQHARGSAYRIARAVVAARERR